MERNRKRIGLAIGAAVGVCGAVTYQLLGRPRMLRWGLLDEEARQPLPRRRPGPERHPGDQPRHHGRRAALGRMALDRSDRTRSCRLLHARIFGDCLVLRAWRMPTA